MGKTIGPYWQNLSGRLGCFKHYAYVSIPALVAFVGFFTLAVVAQQRIPASLE